jgi:hypothetical protein
MKIEGFFANLKNANEAVSELKKTGIEKAVVDMNDHYIDNRDVQTNALGTEAAASLTDLTQGSGSHIVEYRKSPLSAASPMSSGMGRFEEIADVNCRVIVDIDEADGDKAKQVIKAHGGEIENPHIRKPNIDRDADILGLNSVDELQR